MPIVKIVNMAGNEVGELTLNDKLFGADINGAVLHAAVRTYLMNQRQGYSVHSYPHRGFRRRQKALETKGYRQSSSGFHPFSSVDTRRYRSRT